MVAGDALDDALQEHGIVGRLQRIRHMVEVDFILAGAVFAQRRVSRHILGAAGSGDIVKHLFMVLQFGDGEHLRLAGMPAPFARVRRADRIERRAHRIDQVEFQLGRHHRVSFAALKRSSTLASTWRGSA